MIFIDGRVGDSRSRTPKGKNGYVPRNERYNNLLDTAYADIVEKRKSAKAAGLKYAKKDSDKASQKVNLPSDMTTLDATK